MSKSYRLHNVSIHSARGKDVIAVQVPEHEIDVLRVIHGANVFDRGLSEDEIDLSENSADEYARLQRKYRQPGSADPVRYAFPQGPRDLSRFGFDGRGSAAELPQADVRKHPKPPKEDAEAKPQKKAEAK